MRMPDDYLKKAKKICVIGARLKLHLFMQRTRGKPLLICWRGTAISANLLPGDELLFRHDESSHHTSSPSCSTPPHCRPFQDRHSSSLPSQTGDTSQPSTSQSPSFFPKHDDEATAQGFPSAASQSTGHSFIPAGAALP